MKPAFKKGFGDLKMRRIGGGDGYEINRIVLRFFTSQHVLPAAIGAIAQSQAAAIANSLVWSMIQCASRELKQAIKPRAQAMRWTNLAAFTAANHTPL